MKLFLVLLSILVYTNCQNLTFIPMVSCSTTNTTLDCIYIGSFVPSGYVYVGQSQYFAVDLTGLSYSSTSGIKIQPSNVDYVAAFYLGTSMFPNANDNSESITQNCTTEWPICFYSSIGVCDSSREIWYITVTGISSPTDKVEFAFQVTVEEGAGFLCISFNWAPIFIGIGIAAGICFILCVVGCCFICLRQRKSNGYTQINKHRYATPYPQVQTQAQAQQYIQHTGYQPGYVSQPQHYGQYQNNQPYGIHPSYPVNEQPPSYAPSYNPELK